MCFSPEADFAAGVVVAGVGVETLRRVRAPRELIVGALPLLFGIHQLVEGFVWLSLRGQVSKGVGDAAKQAYIVYAHAVLPAIVPFGFMLLEPDRRRSRWMWPLVCLGVLLGVYLLWQVTAYPVGAQQEARCIDYDAHPERRTDRFALRRRHMRPSADIQPPTPALVRARQPNRRDRDGARSGR